MLKIQERSWLLVFMAPLLIWCLALSTEANASEHGVTRIDDEIAGTAYTLMRPENWNGDLVLLVHGSIPNDFEALAPGFTAQGFGVAFVTLAPFVGEGDIGATKAATIGTKQVHAKFTSRFGRPDKVYLFGFSRGAEAMTRLVETSSARYDGMLSICGANGGTPGQSDYFFTARVLFDHYFPGVLPGSPTAMPDIDLGQYLFAIAPTVVDAVMQNPIAAMEMAAVDQLDLQYNDFGELINGIVQSLLIHTVTANDVVEAARGNPFDNSLVQYTGTNDDATLNANVARLIADPQSRRYQENWYEPNGSSGGTPVILLHTSRDPIVPGPLNNDKYESLMTASGNSDFLLRRTVDRFGHCTFGPEEIFGNFGDLVFWAETGIKPAQ
jgi:pimeloyl-ACP methyl ester carboxylesterase